MNNFAVNQLYKFGWKEGKGLGKLEDGITKPIKASMKCDKAGIGHNGVKDSTSGWWAHAFNNAAKRISVVDQKPVMVSHEPKVNDKHAEKKQEADKKYKMFVKSGTLIQNEENRLEEPVANSESDESIQNWLSDEELFSACGGRTAHKAARFGLKMNGKLKRLEKQESIFSKKIKLDHNINHNDSVSVGTLPKKKLNERDEGFMENMIKVNSGKKKKKRKKS